MKHWSLALLLCLTLAAPVLANDRLSEIEAQLSDLQAKVAALREEKPPPAQVKWWKDREGPDSPMVSVRLDDLLWIMKEHTRTHKVTSLREHRLQKAAGLPLRGSAADPESRTKYPWIFGNGQEPSEEDLRWVIPAGD